MEIVRQKNVATRIVFPIVDADGDLVTGAAGLDSEIDEFADGSNPTGFTDCTNEATEIGSTGIYYLNLTQTEMNNDYLVVQVKTSTTGAKTQVILIRTLVGDPLLLATTDDGGAINVASGIVEAQVKSIDNNAITANSIATDAITAAKIAADAIGASELAADAVTEIQSGLSTLNAAGIRSAVGLASANLDTQLSTIDDFLDTEIAAIKAKTDQLTFTNANKVDAAFNAAGDFPQAAADKVWSSATRTLTSLGAALVQEIWDRATSALSTAGSIGKLLVDNINATISSRASQTSVDTIDDYVDTEIGAIKTETDKIASIKAKTDNLPASPAATSDIPSAATIADAVWDEAQSGHTSAGTFGKYLDTEVSGVSGGGGGSGPTAAQIADAVWDEKVDDHLSDRSFGMKVGIHLPFVAPDIDYKKITKIVDEGIAKQEIPEPKEPDLTPISEGLQALLVEIRSIDIPKPEKADFAPVLKRLEAIQKAVESIEVPETDLEPILDQLETMKVDMKPELMRGVEAAQALIERMKEFYGPDIEGISEKLEALSKQLKRIPMIVMSSQPQEEEKKSSLDEYLKS